MIAAKYQLSDGLVVMSLQSVSKDTLDLQADENHGILHVDEGKDADDLLQDHNQFRVNISGDPTLERKVVVTLATDKATIVANGSDQARVTATGLAGDAMVTGTENQFPITVANPSFTVVTTMPGTVTYWLLQPDILHWSDDEVDIEAQ